MKKIYQIILFNYSIKRCFARFFFSSYIQESSIYKKILKKRIKKVSNLYKDKPYCVRIENTNLCNAHCIMCPRDQMKRTVGSIAEDVYAKIIDEAADLGVEYINLHNFGEPLLDPHFCKKVAYAKEKGIKIVSTNSNGSVLNEEVSRKLIDAGLDKLFVSIDAATKDRYEKVRRGLKYDNLVANIKNFIHLRRQLKQNKPELIVNFVLVKNNKDETRQFIKNWQGIADQVSISFSHDWAGDKKDLEVKEFKYLIPCRLLWTELTIAWNGDYLLCCQDYDGKVTFGNIKEKSIKDAWQDKKLKFYRKSQLEEGRQNLFLCSSCKLNTFWWF